MNAHPRKSSQSGFNLTELMIAVALGLIVLASLTSFFVNTSSNRREIDRSARQIENGRFAIDSLRQEIRIAGFFSDLNTSAAVWQTPDPCETDSTLLGVNMAALNVPVPFFGFGSDTTAAACVVDRLPGTDVLVVRRFHTEGIAPAAAASFPVSQHPYVQISRCNTDSTLTPWVYNLGPGPWPLRKLDCSARAELYRLRVVIFYIRSYSVAGDNIPTLVRLDLDNTEPASLYPAGIRGSELVEGIRDMRIGYGIDNNNDGAPDEYRRCSTAEPCTELQWANVTAVRVHVLSENLEGTLGYVDRKQYDMGFLPPAGPINDDKKRHAYSALISATNRSGSRER